MVVNLEDGRCSFKVRDDTEVVPPIFLKRRNRTHLTWISGEWIEVRFAIGDADAFGLNHRLTMIREPI